MQLDAFAREGVPLPLVGYDMPPDRHFKKSMELAEGILPAEKSVMMNKSLKFAAMMMVGSRSGPGQLGNEALKAVGLLKQRWRSVMARLEGNQQGSTRQVTMAQDIRMPTLLTKVLLWPGYTSREHLVLEFSSTGHCHWSGGFPRREVTPSDKINPHEGAAQHSKDLPLSMHWGKDDYAILERSMVDIERSLVTRCYSSHGPYGSHQIITAPRGGYPLQYSGLSPTARGINDACIDWDSKVHMSTEMTRCSCHTGAVYGGYRCRLPASPGNIYCENCVATGCRCPCSGCFPLTRPVGRPRRPRGAGITGLPDYRNFMQEPEEA